MKMRKLVIGRDAIAINEAEIDKEWVRIPEQIFDAAEKQTEAEIELMLVKQKCDRVQGKVFQRISAKPEKYNVTSTTVASINAAVEINDKVLAANEELVEAKRKLEHRKNVLMALIEKRRAMEQIVTLIGLNIRSSEPKDRTGSAEKMKRATLYERRRLKK